jgi:hypothetical protein
MCAVDGFAKRMFTDVHTQHTDRVYLAICLLFTLTLYVNMGKHFHVHVQAGALLNSGNTTSAVIGLKTTTLTLQYSLVHLE